MATKKAAKKPTRTKSRANYDKPELREQLKAKVMKGTKGGRAGQWSARKAQLLAHEYESAGGGYTSGRTESQKHLKQWGEEKWHTRDGKPAKRGNAMARYLPDKAWEKLTPAQRKATDAKKLKASKKGKQFVKNTKPAAKAGARARKKV
jgi:hypothetical protein